MGEHANTQIGAVHMRTDAPAPRAVRLPIDVWNDSAWPIAHVLALDPTPAGTRGESLASRAGASNPRPQSSSEPFGVGGKSSGLEFLGLPSDWRSRCSSGEEAV